MHIDIVDSYSFVSKVLDFHAIYNCKKNDAVVPHPLACFSRLLFPRTCANSLVCELCIIMYIEDIHTFYDLCTPLKPVNDLSHLS